MIRLNIIERLKLVFNFNNKLKKDKRSAGIICEGKNATLIKCKGSGPDAGIIDKGENTTFINSKGKVSIRNESIKWHNIWWIKNIVFPIAIGAILLFIALILKYN